MKTNAVLCIAIVCISPFYCFGQHTASIAPIVDKKDDDRVIVAYRVEETIHLISGKRITTYEVSKLEMVNTYDLGPNNTREVIPIYRKSKVKPAEIELVQKVINDSVSIIKPFENEVAAPPEEERYVMIDIVSTYAKIVDKGYKSEDMLKKVADKSYFEGNLESAVKYYSQLIDINENVDPVYYYRYAVSLKANNQIDKAQEMMKLFESKNSVTTLDGK